MKICPSCNQPTNNTSYIEVFSNGDLVHGVDLCIHCQDEFYNNLPLYEEGFITGHQILTQEEFIKLLNNPKIKNCPQCGHSPEDLSKSGTLGCPYCYTHFHQFLVDFNLEYHESDEHVGKIPKNFSDNEEIKKLKLQLAHAKEHEKFTEVAVLLDQIRKLEK